MNTMPYTQKAMKLWKNLLSNSNIFIIRSQPHNRNEHTHDTHIKYVLHILTKQSGIRQN